MLSIWQSLFKIFYLKKTLLTGKAQFKKNLIKYVHFHRQKLRYTKETTCPQNLFDNRIKISLS